MASLIFPLEWGVNSSSANKGEESSSLKWSEEKIRNICSSLLNPESVSKFSEDVELQGMLMLLESVFRIFKNVKDRHEQTKVAYQTMKHDLVAAKEELCQVKEDLTRHNETTCERCPELEKSLAAQKRKLAHNENQIRSIVNILNFNNTSEHSQPTQKNAVAKAYNLVSQMLLNNNDNDNSMESQKRNVEKRIKHDTTELSQLISPRRKKLKESIKIDALNKENNFNEVEIFCYGSTLVPESVPNFEIPRMDGDKSIPETLCTQNTNIINTDRIDYIQTTPKKLRHDQSSNQRCSPILRSSVRKSAHKSTPGISSNLTEDIQNDHSPKICEKKNKLNTPVISSENDTKSPSLLKIHPERTDLSVIDSKTVKVNERKTEEDEQNASQNNSQDNKKIPADFWKLRQSNDVDMDFKNLNRGGSRKLKQTTLSLGCFAKKQDLCTLKEFNGGIRKSANESDSLLEKINGDLDEEASFQLAIQDSLKENYELAALQNKDTEIENVTESVGEDNDFVLSSPNGEQSKSSPTGKGGNSRLKISLRRKHDFLNKQKRNKIFLFERMIWMRHCLFLYSPVQIRTILLATEKI